MTETQASLFEEPPEKILLFGKEKRVRDYLAAHPKRRFKAPELAELFRTHDWHPTAPGLRDIIRSLRDKGMPICSDTKGFFWSTDPKDLNTFCANLNARIKGIARVRDAVMSRNGIR